MPTENDDSTLVEEDGPVIPLMDDPGLQDTDPPSDDTTPDPSEFADDSEVVNVDEPAEPKDKRSRKQVRYDTLLKERDEARAAEIQVRQNLAHMQGQLDALRQQSPQPPPPTAPAEDPKKAIRDELGSIRRRREGLLAEARALGETPDPATLRRLEDEDLELQIRFSQKAAELSRPAAPAAPQMSPEDVRASSMRTAIEMQFPDVAHNQQAQQWSQGRYHQLVAEGWPAGDMQTIQKAWLDTRQVYGGQKPQAQTPGIPGFNPPPGFAPPPASPAGGYPAPPQTYMPPGVQSRTTGPPRGEGSSADAGGPLQVRMTPEHKMQADLVYNYEPDQAKRYQRYANEVLKPAILEERRRKST